MKKIHVLAISLIVGLGSMVGLATAAQTVGIGRPGAQQASAAEIAAREQKLERTQTALRTALEKKPPALPAAPSPAVAPRQAVQASSSRATQVAVSSSSHDDDDDDDHLEHEDDDGDDD